MANVCFNYVTISGSADNMAVLYQDLQANKFDAEMCIVDSLEYIKESDNKIAFTAESRWVPPFEVLKRISEDYRVEIACQYDECSADMAGEFCFNSGENEYENNYGYLEGMYRFCDWYSFIENEAIPRMENYEDLEEYLEDFEFCTQKERDELAKLYTECMS
jgi:hypothetical protein